MSARARLNTRFVFQVANFVLDVHFQVNTGLLKKTQFVLQNHKKTQEPQWNTLTCGTCLMFNFQIFIINGMRTKHLYFCLKLPYLSLSIHETYWQRGQFFQTKCPTRIKLSKMSHRKPASLKKFSHTLITV